MYGWTSNCHLFSVLCPVMSPYNNSDHCQKEDSLNRADGSELLRRQFDGQITSIQQSNSNSFPSRAYIWAMGSWGLQYQTRIPSSAVDMKPNQVVVGYPVTNIGLILSSWRCCCTSGSRLRWVLLSHWLLIAISPAICRASSGTESSPAGNKYPA